VSSQDPGTGGAAWAGFDWSRERYEDLIARVVPDYFEQDSLFVDAVREVAPDEGHGPFRVLELGAGAGNLARLLLQTFPRVEVTAMDVSAVMLAACRQTLEPFGGRARVVEGDFASAGLGSGYRAVVSRLAIHHLDDPGKEALFGRVFAALDAGGVFVISDMIVGATPEESGALMAEWRDYMVARGDDPDEWLQWLVGDDDLPASVQAQMAWLQAAGFNDVQVIWKRAGFAMLSGRRIDSPPVVGVGCQPGGMG